MNCLVFFPHELHSDALATTAVLRNQRAQHALELHQVKLGLRLKAAVFGAKLGFADVTKICDHEIHFRIECNQDPPSRLALHLIVAVPRPHLVRKTLQIAAMSGVERLSFIRSDKVVPSYLQSKSLSEDQIKLQLLNGLEQAADCIAPEVKIYCSNEAVWTELVNSELEQSTLRWGDTHAGKGSRLGKTTDRLTLCFGPEAGWSERERVKFSQLGIEPFSLGPRMLRLDVALAAALGAATL